MGWMHSTMADGQRREDNTRPPLHQPQFQSNSHQTSSASSRIDNRDSFNFNHNQVDNAYNDYSETHYYGRVPPANQRVRPQYQTQSMGNGVLPQSIQFIGQRARALQTFPNRSLSEGNVPQNMPRNNNEDDEEFDESNDPNRPPPLSTSSEPIIRTFEGNYIKHDNSVHKTNISSYNAERNKLENCFNYNYSSRQKKEGTSQQVVSSRRQSQDSEEEEEE